MKRAAGLLTAALLFSAAVYAQAIAYDYSKLYEKASPAVVQIMTDDGSGSGFLISPFGHIQQTITWFVIRDIWQCSFRTDGKSRRRWQR